MNNLFCSDTIFFNNFLFGFINSGHIGQHESLSFSTRSKKIPKNTELRTAIQNNDIYMICLKRYNKNEQSSALTNSKIDIIFDKITDTIENHRRINQNQYIFVVFSECFFGEDKPLDDAQVSYIVEKCRQLSSKNKVLIISTFLHKFNISNRPNWLKGKYNPITKRKEIHERVTETSCTENGKKITKHMLVADNKHTNRIANYALVFYEHKIVAIYRKSTYHAECDEEVNPQDKHPICAYEFGDFQTHAVENSPITNIFVGDNILISLRICSDLTCPQYSIGTAKYIFLFANNHPSFNEYRYSKPVFWIDDNRGIGLINPDLSSTVVGHIESLNLKDFCSYSYCVCYPFDFQKLITTSNPIFPDTWWENAKEIP